jgi:hypothetical protein
MHHGQVVLPGRQRVVAQQRDRSRRGASGGRIHVDLPLVVVDLHVVATQNRADVDVGARGADRCREVDGEERVPLARAGRDRREGVRPDERALERAGIDVGGAQPRMLLVRLAEQLDHLGRAERNLRPGRRQRELLWLLPCDVIDVRPDRVAARQVALGAAVGKRQIVRERRHAPARLVGEPRQRVAGARSEQIRLRRVDHAARRRRVRRDLVEVGEPHLFPDPRGLGKENDRLRTVVASQHVHERRDAGEVPLPAHPRGVFPGPQRDVVLHPLQRLDRAPHVLGEPLLDAHLGGEGDDHDFFFRGLRHAQHVLGRVDHLRAHQHVEERVVEREYHAPLHLGRDWRRHGRAFLQRHRIVDGAQGAAHVDRAHLERVASQLHRELFRLEVRHRLAALVEGQRIDLEERDLDVRLAGGARRRLLREEERGRAEYDDKEDRKEASHGVFSNDGQKKEAGA